MTDESNSAFFRLTPIASQNVTQKTNLFNGGNSTNRNEKTTESHNLNYSYSELESEWGGVMAMQNLNQGNPGSGNTTGSKIKNEGKVKKLAQREAQKLKLLKS